ncbi:MAG TPA: alkaline phosphatase, partial [Pedobacter sp.]
MTLRKLLCYSSFVLLLSAQQVQAQQPLSANRGHSHNDYKQNIPLLRAYYAGMGSIEADVFFRNGQLFVAHELKEINPDATLKGQYLAPLFKLFKQNGNHPYAGPGLKLQLVIDIKEDHQHVLPQLVKELKPYMEMVRQGNQPDGISIVISGDMPIPAHFKDYPDFITYDGRPATVYTIEELKRVAMISDELSRYTTWNGKGT